MNTLLRLPLLAALALLPCSLPAVAAPYASAACAFSVDMPGPVKESTTKRGGHMYAAEAGDNAFVAECSELSEAVRKSGASAKVLLGRARDAMVDDATLISEKSLTLQGHPALDIQVKTHDGYYMRFRVIIAHQRLYQVGVVTDVASAPEVAPFLDSFRLNEK